TLMYSKVLPSLLVVIAASISAYFSFGSDHSVIQILSGFALTLLALSPLINAWREAKRRSSTEESEFLEEPIYSGPTDLNSIILSVLSVGLMALLPIFPVRWPASLAFGLSMANLSLRVATRTPVRDMLVAFVAMISVWPLSADLVARAETRVESYLSRLVGDRLDSSEILNYPSGSHVQTLKGDVPVTGTTGNLTGIRLAALVACCIGLLMSRGPIHTGILSLSGVFWAVVVNGFWAYGQALVLNNASGMESLWANPFLAGLGCLILLLSTDQLLLVLGLLNPIMWIRRERKRSGLATQASEDPEVEEEVLEQKPELKIPDAAFWALGAVALVMTVQDVRGVLNQSTRDKAVEQQWRDFAKSNSNTLWPDRLGQWVRSNTEILGEAPNFSHQQGTTAISGTYVQNNRVVRVCWIGPASGWVDRFQDYVLNGWKLGSNVRVVPSTNGSKPYLVSDLSQPTGEKALLIYAMTSLKDESNLEPSIRSLARVASWHFLQSLFLNGGSRNEYYLTEICLESYTSPKENEVAIIDEIVKQALALPLPDGLKLKN
ncbi:MAG: hypothetical protein RJA81_1456, partial [Planctomycetota bacterium]